VYPAKIELDGGVATARFAQVIRQCLHALEVRGIDAGLTGVRLSWQRGEATPALDMPSCKVQELAV
jgi:hypothetical protein